MQIRSPNRVTHTYTQNLVAPPAAVFPLLCPVREADWIEGWEPAAVFSVSGFAEPDCVFLTAADTGHAIWYVTRLEPANGLVEMLKITPAVTACKLTIWLRPSATGSEATVSYSHTSLGPAGDAFLASFTEAHYEQFMREWEARLNHYLTHGTALRITRAPASAPA